MIDPATTAAEPLLSGGNETDARNRSILRSMLSTDKDTAAIIGSESLLMASVLLYMIPMNPTNTKGYFSGYEQGLLITGAFFFAISALIDGLFVKSYYAEAFVIGILGLFFIFATLFIALIDFNADESIVAAFTRGRAMIQLAFFALGCVCHYTMIAVLKYQEKKKVVPAMLFFILKAIASILIMTAAIVEWVSNANFDVFRNLMFSGCIFHAVASLGVIVSTFMKPAE